MYPWLVELLGTTCRFKKERKTRCCAFSGDRDDPTDGRSQWPGLSSSKDDWCKPEFVTMTTHMLCLQFNDNP